MISRTRNIFSSKLQKSNHPSLTFTGTCITLSEIRKHLGMFLDSKLDFKEHIQNVLNKVSKTIELLSKLQKILPRSPLISIYLYASSRLWKFYLRSTYNVSFLEKLESIRYNVSLAITGAIRGISRSKHHELGFEYLESRRWYRKLCCFYKLSKTQSPRYLFDVIPTAKRGYITRNDDNLPHFKVKHDYSKNYFFLSPVIEWNKLYLNIRNSEGLTSFRSSHQRCSL